MDNAKYGQVWITFSSNSIQRLRVSVPLFAREQERGLQGFKLRPGEGMMFPSRSWPREEKIPMHMATVDFPLNMIWVSQGRVVRIEENVPPGNRQTFSELAFFCLEIATSDPIARSIRIGDRVCVEN